MIDFFFSNRYCCFGSNISIHSADIRIVHSRSHMSPERSHPLLPHGDRKHPCLFSALKHLCQFTEHYRATCTESMKMPVIQDSNDVSWTCWSTSCNITLHDVTAQYLLMTNAEQGCYLTVLCSSLLHSSVHLLFFLGLSETCGGAAQLFATQSNS